ncbi:MAG: hypothetical protein U5R06_03505 [candidate division KSB1 bacterium]|nr:hypothetical protein [candidate division KSB1 bacterium]
MRQKLPKKQRNAVRWGRYAVILLVLLTVYFFTNVWQSVSITRLLRQNSELKADLRTLKNKNALLVVQHDSLTRPERIRAVLKGKVQLQNAETINIFTNESGE